MFLLENLSCRVPVVAWVLVSGYTAHILNPTRHGAWDRALQAVEDLCSS